MAKSKLIKKMRKNRKRINRTCSYRYNNTIKNEEPIIGLSEIAIIYKSEMDYISRCILDYKNIETGGELFGFWTADGTPVVLYAIGPGPKANHQLTFFNQDVDYLKKTGNSIVSKYGLLHIGEWHSHHRLGLAQPSAHDVTTMFNGIKTHNLHRFLCCIGNCNDTSSILNAFNFSENKYVKACWKIIKVDSPFRYFLDGELKGILNNPTVSKPVYCDRYSENSKTIYPSGYWLNIDGNQKILKKILDYVAEKLSIDTEVYLDADNLVHLISIKNNLKYDIFFRMGFPNVSPTISAVDSRNQIIRQYNDAKWEFSDNIYETFKNFFTEVYNDRL